jgi:NADH dehydrogenase/NADH:ubiquinone oxidoreductase subunit G
MVRVSINNQQREFASGITILYALNSVGIEVPTLCHDERLKPAGDCRMCLVKVEDMPHPVASCITPLFRRIRGKDELSKSG